MAKPLYLLAVALTLGSALALCALAGAQSHAPASRITEARQNTPQKPTSQPSPVSASAPATNSGGAEKSSDSPAEDPPALEAADGAVNTGLRTLIQDAMGKQPSLAGSTINVSVTGEGIELSGNVSSSRERLTAARLAHSYAAGRRVINHIVITERGGSPQPQQQ